MFITIVLSAVDVATMQDVYAPVFFTIYHPSPIQAMLIILYESENHKFGDAQVYYLSGM
jgi:hypothetical protein